MSAREMETTAKALVANGKGVLAIDESHATIEKRFKSIGIESTPETRRAYREMLLTTSGLGEFISGAILFDETLRQSSGDRTPFTQIMAKQGIIPGIKVDTGAKDLAGRPGEKITEGLDGLRQRLAEYRQLGARFAKWRAVITIGPGIPSHACIAANAHALARYAALCQEASLVPIVEPEVLMDGDHTLERSYEVTENTLHSVFNALYHQGVVLEQMILKASMVISGADCPKQAGIQAVAEATVRCLLRTVPAAVPGIAFLSGGQSNELASAHLNAMNAEYKNLPWPLSFSYGRALQQPALKAWKGKTANVAAAQKALHHRAKCNSAAALGRYNEKMEKELAA